MKRTRVWAVLLSLAMCFCFAAPAFAATCPIVKDTKHSALWWHLNTAPVGNDYKMEVVDSGGMWEMHETWTCAYCGMWCAKTSYVGTPKSIEGKKMDKNIVRAG